MNRVDYCKAKAAEKKKLDCSLSCSCVCSCISVKLTMDIEVDACAQVSFEVVKIYGFAIVHTLIFTLDRFQSQSSILTKDGFSLNKERQRTGVKPETDKDYPFCHLVQYKEQKQ